MSVKAVVFDYGGVISLPQDQKAMDEIAKLAGVEKEKIVQAIWALRGDYDRGTISAKEYFKNVLASLSVYKDDKTVGDIIELDINSWKSVNTETEALMKELKEAGYLVGILSNIPHEYLSWAKKNVPAFSIPHASIYSCDVHLIKPEEAIYKKTLSLFDAGPDELVFFDDKAENIAGAKALGIKAILWKNPKQARNELISLGVKL